MKIFWIIIITLGIRMIGLNQSLWLDEAISVNVATNYSYEEIIKSFSPNDFHPPLYYLMLKTWTDIFGNTEISVRTPSIIFSLITVFIVYLLAGPAAAGLTAVNPLLLYYSQEARMYSMVTMLLTLAMYFLIKKKYWWYSLMALLSFMTFYGSIFLLTAVGIYLLFKRQYKALVITSIGTILAIIILFPLLALQTKHSQEMLFTVKNWSLVLGKANLKNLFLIPMKFTSGRISFYPKIIYYAISGCFSVLVFKPLVLRTLPLKKGSEKNIGFYSYLFWSTLFIGVIFSIFTPMLQYFRFIYLIPLMGLIIRKDKLITAGFLIFSLMYLFNQSYWRENWKDLSRILDKQVYMIDSFGDPIKYYRPEIKINDIRGEINETKITVIPYGEKIHGVDHKNILEKQGYLFKNTISFRGVNLEYWQSTP